MRQLRLRDIGGIIVIDFIDMARARNRDAVLKTLRKALDEDRTKTFVVEISPLGLVEMTRQNVTDGVREIMTKTCPTCDGEGVVSPRRRSRSTSSARLRELVKERPEARGLPGAGQPARHGAVLTGDGGAPLHALEEETGKLLPLRGLRGPAARPLRDHAEGTREEIEERALPFRAGEEVHVHIVEPHMYNVDDAVAKIDGYLISVAGGGAPRGREEARADRGGGAHGGQRAGARRTPRTAATSLDRCLFFPAPGPQRRTAPVPCNGRILMTYAIVKTGGKQYRVQEGQSLLVERLPEDEGAKVALEPLLYRGDGRARRGGSGPPRRGTACRRS